MNFPFYAATFQGIYSTCFSKSSKILVKINPTKILRTTLHVDLLLWIIRFTYDDGYGTLSVLDSPNGQEYWFYIWSRIYLSFWSSQYTPLVVWFVFLSFLCYVLYTYVCCLFLLLCYGVLKFILNNKFQCLCWYLYPLFSLAI